MFKKIFIISIILIACIFFWFWSIFVKEETVTNKNMVGFCLHKNNIIEVLNFKSAKVLTNVKCKMEGSILKVDPKTTTVFNPFLRQMEYQSFTITITPQIKYLQVGASKIALATVHDCFTPSK